MTGRDGTTRRSVLQGLAASAAGLATSGLATSGLVISRPLAAAEDTLAGLGEAIDHIVVIFQENRSFDHYFGTYRSPHGAAVDTLLDTDGEVDARFAGVQTNPAGVAYGTLPLASDVPGLATAKLGNAPFHLAPFIPADANVPYDPAHNFFRMAAQINDGRMDRFIALAQAAGHPPLDTHARHRPRTSALGPDVSDAMRLFEQSRPSGVVVGHYGREDLPAYHRLADEYVLFDRFFQAMSGGSTGNALYLAAARSCVWTQAPAELRGSLRPPRLDMPYDRDGILINDLPPVQGPTATRFEKLAIAPPPEQQTYANIGDRLDAAGIGWAWYNEGWSRVKSWALKTATGPGDGSAVIDTTLIYSPHHNPFQYYPQWPAYVRAGHIRDIEDFRADVASGTLPAVSLLKATAGHDEHPAHSAPAIGMDWVMTLLRDLAASPLWPRTLVLVTYDEGGGFWDHVAPPRADAYGFGTRVPALMIGALARRGYVDHHVASTGSVLRLIERRFGLDPLTERDARAYDLLAGLDFAAGPQEPRFA